MPDDDDTNRQEGLPRPGFVPVPDPTLLTTRQLLREILALREILEAKIAGNSNKIENLERLIEEKIHCITEQTNERFKSIQMQFNERDSRTEQTTRDNKVAIDAALQAAKEAAAAIDEKTAHLQALHDEKFRSIAVQFSERDVRAEQTARDSKVAVDAALQAAKEAVGEQNRSSALSIAKSEAGTVKQIDQIQLWMQTATGAIESKIADVKDRITIIESAKIGQTEQRSQTQGSQIQWVGIMGLVLGAVIGLGGVLMSLNSSSAPVVPIPERVVIEQVPPNATLP